MHYSFSVVQFGRQLIAAIEVFLRIFRCDNSTVEAGDIGIGILKADTQIRHDALDDGIAASATIVGAALRQGQIRDTLGGRLGGDGGGHGFVSVVWYSD